MNLPEEIAGACEPLFSTLPMNQAMGQLVGGAGTHADLLELVLKNAALSERPALAAALWLYVGDLDKSHRISQSVSDSAGSYWHGIMHRREGDFSNSHYWMRNASAHPLRASRPDLDPDALIDAVAAAGGKNLPDLVQRQREEWAALFEWTAQNT